MQSHLSVCHVGILTVIQNCHRNVVHIQDVKNQIVYKLCYSLDLPRMGCNVMQSAIMAAGEWIDEITVGIIADKCLGTFTHSLAN
jgi:hypothetical protein